MIRDKATVANATILGKLDAGNRAILEITRNVESLGVQPEVVIMANRIQHITATGHWISEECVTPT